MFPERVRESVNILQRLGVSYTSVSQTVAGDDAMLCAAGGASCRLRHSYVFGDLYCGNN